MIRRRIKAVVEFGMGVFLCWFVLRVRKFRYDHADEVDGDEPEPLSPRWVATGAVTSAINMWLRDRDAYEIRTNRRRRFLFSALRFGLGRMGRRFASNSEEVTESNSLGVAIGLVAYRLWYGILRPLPRSSE